MPNCPPRSNDGRANGAGAVQVKAVQVLGENRGQAGENPYATGSEETICRPNNGASHRKSKKFTVINAHAERITQLGLYALSP